MNFHHSAVHNNLNKQLRLEQLTVVSKFLHDSNFIEIVKEENKFNEYKKEDALFAITVPVDLMQLAETDSELANFVILNPREGAILFQEVVHQMLIVHQIIPDTVEVTQVATALRVTAAALPKFNDLGFKQLSYKGLAIVSGVVAGVTPTVKYTKSTRYICPNENCDGHWGNKYVRVHIPGASEKEMVGHNFHCFTCSLSLTEVPSQRSLSEKLVAEVVPLHLLKGSFGRLETGCRQQAVSIIVRDDLSSQITLGQYCELVGTQRTDHEGENINILFEVNNILQRKGPTSLISALPGSVGRLFHTSICPPGYCLKLKLMLLMSLALTPELPPLHVLSACKEIDIVHRLMENFCQLAARGIHHSSLKTLGASVSSNRYQWSPYFVQAGSLVLAREGVCCMPGDIRAMKRADKQELQTAMNEGRVQVTLESRHTGSLPCVLQYPLACQVWAHTASASAAMGSSLLGACSSVDLPPSLMDAFSVTVIEESAGWGSSDKVEHELSDYLLAASMKSKEGDPGNIRQEETHGNSISTLHESVDISTYDFAQYLLAARCQTSTMTVEADWVLTTYLNAVRRARASSTIVSGTYVPVSAWQTLKAMSHALCRLNLRHEILESDALMAAMMFEETLAARYGISALNVPPCPHLPSDVMKEYLDNQDLRLRKFHAGLLNFSGRCPSTLFHTEE